jgi:hypothetical protein
MKVCLAQPNEFVDAQIMAIKHPETFEAPSIEDLNNVEVGNWVKVCHEKGQERFWTEVVEKNGEDIIGRVDNDLVNVETFNYNDYINFKTVHIYQTLDK